MSSEYLTALLDESLPEPAAYSGLPQDENVEEPPPVEEAMKEPEIVLMLDAAKALFG